MSSNDPTAQQFEQDLAYTRRHRERIINTLAEDPGTLKDTETTRVLLTALNDMDKQTLGKKRLDVDAQVGNLQQQALALISEIYSNPSLRRPAEAPNEAREAPELDDSFGPPTVVPGELDTRPQALTYETFMGEANPT